MDHRVKYINRTQHVRCSIFIKPWVFTRKLQPAFWAAPKARFLVRHCKDSATGCIKAAVFTFSNVLRVNLLYVISVAVKVRQTTQFIALTILDCLLLVRTKLLDSRTQCKNYFSATFSSFRAALGPSVWTFFNLTKFRKFPSGWNLQKPTEFLTIWLNVFKRIKKLLRRHTK